MNKLHACRYCKRETKEPDFCSLACKQKYQQKEDSVLIQQGAVRPSTPISEQEKSLQEKFLKKIGKRKAKKKLIVSKGVL